MSHAERCPVCHGRGKISKIQGWTHNDDHIEHKTCHGCGGKGWVEVSDETSSWLWMNQPNPKIQR